MVIGLRWWWYLDSRGKGCKVGWIKDMHVQQYIEYCEKLEKVAGL
jgi:hypothetical protein